MNNNPLVSICIPVYNSGQYIDETLESLINQTYKNIEIIVSDNASTDNTKKIILDKQSIDSRISYFRNYENIGYVNNIKNAVSKAKGDFIAIFHSDDIYENTIIRKEMDQLLKNENIGAVFSILATFSELKPNNLKFPKLYVLCQSYPIYDSARNIFIGGMKEYLPVITKYGNIFTCPSLMCRKKIYLEIGGYKDTYPSNEDFDLWLRTLILGYRIVMINEPLLKYRLSKNQGSSIYSNLTDLPMVYDVLRDFKNNNPQLFGEKSLIKNYNSFLTRGYCRAAFNCYKKREYKKGLLQIINSKKNKKYNIFTKIGVFQFLGGIYFWFMMKNRNKK